MSNALLSGLLNTIEAAKVVGLAPQTLMILRLRGRGPRFVKLGRRVLYDPADIAAWIEANKRLSTSE
jgi:predicted DNA-binding transcriptional regulator AlpA